MWALYTGGRSLLQQPCFELLLGGWRNLVWRCFWPSILFPSTLLHVALLGSVAAAVGVAIAIRLLWGRGDGVSLMFVFLTYQCLPLFAAVHPLSLIYAHPWYGARERGSKVHGSTAMWSPPGRMHAGWSLRASREARRLLLIVQVFSTPPTRRRHRELSATGEAEESNGHAVAEWGTPGASAREGSHPSFSVPDQLLAPHHELLTSPPGRALPPAAATRPGSTAGRGTLVTSARGRVCSPPQHRSRPRGNHRGSCAAMAGYHRPIPQQQRAGARVPTWAPAPKAIREDAAFSAWLCSTDTMTQFDGRDVLHSGVPFRSRILCVNTHSDETRHLAIMWRTSLPRRLVISSSKQELSAFPPRLECTAPSRECGLPSPAWRTGRGGSPVG